LVIRNEAVTKLLAEIPEGHKHIRITLFLDDGTEFTFLEATAANLVHAYISVKTHPGTNKVCLYGKPISDRKEGFAEWQLIEQETGYMNHR
jgi:hypothetical protein